MLFPFFEALNINRKKYADDHLTKIYYKLFKMKFDLQLALGHLALFTGKGDCLQIAENM